MIKSKIKVAVATDQFLQEQKAIIDLLVAAGYNVINVNRGRKLNIWNVSFKVADLVQNQQVARAIIIDDYAQTSFMIASKFANNIVASLYDEYSAAFAMKHNNANIICVGLALTGFPLIQKLITVYLANAFEGGRHQVRSNMLNQLLTQESS